jgi:hypothetical protein
MGMSSGYGEADEAGGVATLHEAIDRGCTFLDTADAYGPHANERALHFTVEYELRHCSSHLSRRNHRDLWLLTLNSFRRKAQLRSWTSEEASGQFRSGIRTRSRFRRRRTAAARESELRPLPERPLSLQCGRRPSMPNFRSGAESRSGRRMAHPRY